MHFRVFLTLFKVTFDCTGISLQKHMLVKLTYKLESHTPLNYCKQIFSFSVRSLLFIFICLRLCIKDGSYKPTM